MAAASVGVWLRRAGPAAARLSRAQGSIPARCCWRGLADGRRSEESQFARDLEGNQLRVRAWGVRACGRAGMRAGGSAAALGLNTLFFAVLRARGRARRAGRFCRAQRPAPRAEISV